MGNTAFSMNGRTVIEAKNGKILESVARRDDDDVMTQNDITAVKAMYSCSSGTVNPVNPSETGVGQQSTVRIDNDISNQLDIYVDGRLSNRLPAGSQYRYYYTT